MRGDISSSVGGRTPLLRVTLMMTISYQYYILLLLLYWDAEKFYDSLRPTLVLQSMYAKRYNVHLLALTAMIHWSPRWIRHCNALSSGMNVTTSIVAGCPTANALARGYIYDLMRELHDTFPAQMIRTFVDDLAQIFGPAGRARGLDIQSVAVLSTWIGKKRGQHIQEINLCRHRP